MQRIGVRGTVGHPMVKADIRIALFLPMGVREVAAVMHREAPTAQDIDMAHQATGVPSLGQESMNFVAGPR